MSGSALAFLIGSWAAVLSLTAWCFARVLRTASRRDEEDVSNRESER